MKIIVFINLYLTVILLYFLFNPIDNRRAIIMYDCTKPKILKHFIGTKCVIAGDGLEHETIFTIKR